MNGFPDRKPAMELITTGDLLKSNKYLRIFGGEVMARAIFRVLCLDRINEYYSKSYHLSGPEFLDRIIEMLGITMNVSREDLEKIPDKGNFITVSNHAYGGIDGILLAKILSDVRPDYKLLVNFLLTKIRPMKPYFLGVNPFESFRDLRSSYGGLKEAYRHLQEGHPLGLFPAGEVSSYKLKQGAVADREWQYSILKFIKKAKLPVVPVYFHGHNSVLFNLLGFIHPMLRTVRLPAEFLNKQGREIRIRIGSPVSLREQDEFTEIGEFGKMLRMKTYSLARMPEPPVKLSRIIVSHPAHIVEETPEALIRQEIDDLMAGHLLFSLQGHHVFCAPSQKIPNILREIGRLREITYREVGEGTAKPIDIDPYDEYFEQLFIWDSQPGKIVGGYRVGKGEDIFNKYGIAGHYINSLFKIDRKFEPVLRVSMELGRSFIVKEYQKKPLSLFLLWKGILYLLLKAPKYRYLIGPVSISSEFSGIARTLVVKYLATDCYNSEYGALIKPRSPFRRSRCRHIDPALFLRYVKKDISRLDRFIQDMDHGLKIPVLLKKYLSVNSEVIGFNIDRKFNNCLDALIILDLFDVPLKTIESLSKEFNDPSIAERFRKET